MCQLPGDWPGVFPLKCDYFQLDVWPGEWALVTCVKHLLCTVLCRALSGVGAGPLGGAAACWPTLTGHCALDTRGQVAGVTLHLDRKHRLRGHMEMWYVGLADGLRTMGTLASRPHAPCPEALGGHSRTTLGFTVVRCVSYSLECCGCSATMDCSQKSFHRPSNS